MSAAVPPRRLEALLDGFLAPVRSFLGLLGTGLKIDSHCDTAVRSKQIAYLSAQVAILRNENVALMAMISKLYTAERMGDEFEGITIALADAHERTAAHSEDVIAAQFLKRARNLRRHSEIPRHPKLRLVEREG